MPEITAEQIQNALKMLDVEADENWTDDGFPSLDALSVLLGGAEIKRKAVVDAAPTFNREAALEAAAGAEAQGEDPEPVVEEAIEDDGEALLSAIKAIDDEVSVLQGEIATLQGKIFSLQEKRRGLHNRSSLAATSRQDQENRMKYIKRQQEAQAKNAAAAAAVRAALPKAALQALGVPADKL